MLLSNKQTNKQTTCIAIFKYFLPVEVDDINLLFQQMFTAIVPFSFSIVFLKIKVKRKIKTQFLTTSPQTFTANGHCINLREFALTEQEKVATPKKPVTKKWKGKWPWRGLNIF